MATSGKSSKERASGGEARPKGARARILDAAYELFLAGGIGAVGIDTITARAGVAKMSLYRHFKSKDDLVLAYLNMREKRWTEDWLKAGLTRQKSSPEAAFVVIFDMYDRWFHQRDYEGCPFINTLLEVRSGEAVHDAAAHQLASIRAIVQSLAEKAGFRDPDSLAKVWHMLMMGAIVAASAGDKEAARHARRAGEMILAAWPRIEPHP